MSEKPSYFASSTFIVKEKKSIFWISFAKFIFMNKVNGLSLDEDEDTPFYVDILFSKFYNIGYI